MIDQLRALFAEGATPSRLMHEIASRHPGDPDIHHTIRGVIEEAFGVPFVRHVAPDQDYAPSHRHWHFNRDLLPAMCLGLAEAGQPLPPWLDGVAVRSAGEHAARSQGCCPPGLERLWDQFNPMERESVARHAGHHDALWDALKAAAALAERLQEQVLALESRLAAYEADPAGTEPLSPESRRLAPARVG